jgi:hypothetical protein
MPSSESAPRIDASLLRELAEAEQAKSLLQAVVFLRRSDPDGPPPTPEQTESAVERLIERAAEASGERPAALNVFGNLNSFALEASPVFIRSLIASDEVRSARSNRAPSPRIPAPERGKGR